MEDQTQTFPSPVVVAKRHSRAGGSKTVVPLLSTKEAAHILGIPDGTLRQWRCLGVGPTYIKLGDGKKSIVRYAVQDVEQYIHERKHVPSVRANTRRMHERF
jgi:hypothetical protein